MRQHASPAVVMEDPEVDLPTGRDRLETRSDSRFIGLRHHVYAQVQKAKGHSAAKTVG